MPIAARTHRSALLLFVLALTLPLTAQTTPATPSPATTAASTSQEATPSHRAKAQQLIEMLRTEKAVQQNADNLVSQVKEVRGKVSAPDITPEQKAKIDAFEKNATDAIDALVGWKVLEPTFIDIYVKAFTEDQLTDIIAFYKTPAGIAFLDKTPTINEQGGQLERAKMTALQTQLRQLLADLQKSIAPPAPAAPASTTPPAPSAAPAKPASPAAPPAPATSAPK
jgi:hypothetical protein